MIDIKALVPQLQKQVGLLTEDLIAQARSVEATAAFLREHYNKAIEVGRLSQSFEEWSEDYLEQVAVSWVLSCVFVRFLEDNHLIDECWIAGNRDRGKLADGSYEIYFRSYPHLSDRDYLKFVFKEVGKIPATRELFNDEKTPLWAVDPSGDAARRLLLFFKEIDAERGGLRRQFDTREVRTQPLVDVVEKLAPQAQFLGDLYQDISEHARKKYALLQTPEFVQQFILDRTLTPAIDEFGLKGLRLIDPACGSGHFLLGAFDRLFALWMKSEEIRGNPVVAAQNAFDSIYGVDINPFAIAITRFRMLVAAVRACGINRLHQQSYAWKLNLAVGDSLLRGSRPTFGGERSRILLQLEIEFEPVRKLRTEDPTAANEILGQGYHAVVGNPPYITVKDKAQNQNYRDLYSTCHRQYSLGVPFTQRFWELAIRDGEPQNTRNTRKEDQTDDASFRVFRVFRGSGYVGMITANSFMKREFGKKLIEEFFPKIDLTHVIDTSGAYIPGHGTPTVILFGRPREPMGNTVRAVLGIKGEPTTPDDPAQGLVWQSIVKQLDEAGAQDEFTSTADVPRETFASHPWSIGGGGAADLKDAVEAGCDGTLGELIADIGRSTHTGEDDVFYLEPTACRTRRLLGHSVPLVEGEGVRDYHINYGLLSLFPYDQTTGQPVPVTDANLEAHFWQYRTTLKHRRDFGQYIEERGLRWVDHSMFFPARFCTPLSIAFAFVATHNHFVLDRGGKVFNRSAPIIKLPADATEDDHLALLGLLNSSTACFWMKQVMTGKHKGDGGEAHADPAYQRFEFAGTQLQNFPVSEAKPLSLSRRLDEIARQLGELAAERILKRWAKGDDLKASFEEAEAKTGQLRSQMIALQEELDWECYRHYGLLADDLRYPGDDLPELKLGERAFEIVMARQMKRGELQTAWFARHGSTPITEFPAHWPAAYRTLVERRITLIETNKEIGLIERPEYKRRWNTEPWAEQEQRALRNWLLDRLEDRRYWPGVELQTTAHLADRASADAEFMQVAEQYRGRPGFDVAALVAELVGAEAVPLLPVLRYKAPGLRKRAVWERTWELQREEDGTTKHTKDTKEDKEKADDPTDVGSDSSFRDFRVFRGSIPVPPKYTSADFVKPDYWRLRGKLDVPKERWISYPHCSTDSDPSLLVGWAGWNHLRQVEALVSYYDARKRESWDGKRLTPLLAGLDQLLPWVHQWHPDIIEEFGESAGKSYQTLLEQDAHELGLTLEDIRTWQPDRMEPRKTRKKKGETS